MDKFVTGYQYGSDMSFIGEYVFPNNLDKEEIHMPPMTTLVAPPTDMTKDQKAYYNEADDNWIVRDIPVQVSPEPVQPLIPME